MDSFKIIQIFEWAADEQYYFESNIFENLKKLFWILSQYGVYWINWNVHISFQKSAVIQFHNWLLTKCLINDSTLFLTSPLYENKTRFNNSQYSSKYWDHEIILYQKDLEQNFVISVKLLAYQIRVRWYLYSQSIELTL